MTDNPAKTARTFLFVPGDRPERFAKAAASGADLVILDLEDAVPADRKPEAREHARGWLAEGNRAVVRINGDGTPWHDADVAMIAGLPGFVVAVMVPKAERPERLADLSVTLPPGTGIIPLVETAAGILHAPAVCAVRGVLCPAFGSADLSAQLGVDHRSHTALQHARSALVLAAAAAGCAAPVDGVTTGLAGEESLRADLAHALALGFTGKLCVHPRQVAPANECLTPSDAELEWAREAVAAGRSGAATVHDGQMIDRPVVLRAEAILARLGSHRSQGTARRPSTTTSTRAKT